MNKEAVLQQLRASSPHERLKAARELAKSGSADDVPAMKNVLRNETVSWVKKALKIAIESCENPQTPEEPSLTEDQQPDADIRRQIESLVTREVTGTLLHEIEPIVGLLRADAADEVPNFATSKVRSHLDHLTVRIEGLRQLREAASAPRNDEFDLKELLSGIVDHECAGKNVEVQLIGHSMTVTGDPRLLTLALGNGLRNAVDAVCSLPENEKRHGIVINWGVTDIEFWIAILDKGVGLTLPVETAFKIGQSTKKGTAHAGMGLAIAAQALNSMQGDVVLARMSEGGTRFEIRWYR